MISPNLAAELDALGIDCPPKRLGQLETYLMRLVRWNVAMNLTALKGRDLLQRLIVEPLWVFQQLSPGGVYVDVGSGNGSPAIPWLCAGAFSEAHLIEARQRRAVFLHQTCRAMGLSEACSVHARRFSDVFSDQDRESRGPPIVPEWVTIQGVRQTRGLWREINKIRRENTRVVWFTGTESPSAEAPARTLILPFSARRALVYGRMPS